MLIIFYALFAPFSPSLDLMVSKLFYTSGVGFNDNLFFHILFKYGEIIGFVTGAIAIVSWTLSWFIPRWKRWRNGSFAIFLTLLIGAGLVTNVLFKGYWGRPRPKQIIEFGGQHVYRAFWNPDFNTSGDHQKSFPSGHVAMGFYFLSFCFAGKRYRSKLLYRSGVFLTIFLGGGLMVARVAQGGHFLSDVLASPVLMFYITQGLDKLCAKRVLFFTLEEPQEPPLCPATHGICAKPDGL